MFIIDFLSYVKIKKMKDLYLLKYNITKHKCTNY